MTPFTKFLLASLAGATIVAGVLVSSYNKAEALGRDGRDGGRMERMHGRGMFGPPFLGGMILEQIDTDGDGRISHAELVAFRADKLVRFDGGKDGSLTLDEFEGVWMEVTKPFQVRAFQFLDADGDGKVTAEELARPTDRLFSRLDRDGDQMIAPERPGPGRGGPDRR